MSQIIGTNVLEKKDEISISQNLRQNNLTTRLKILLLATTADRGRYNWLEVNTGIPSTTWRMWWTRGGAPGGLLVEAAAKTWPQFAYWLITGCTDIRCGHDMPNLPNVAKGYISNWPEEATMRKNTEKSVSETYLKGCIELAELQEKGEHQNKLKFQYLEVANRERRKEIEHNFEIKLAYENTYIA